MKSPKRKFHKKKKKPPLNPTEKAVMDTLCYRAIFNYPLSYYQLGTFLICKDKIKKEDFDKALESLVRRKRIIKDKSKRFLLKGINYVGWDRRNNDSVTLLAKVEEIAEILKKIPWIKMIGVTGALAAYNAKEDDDIDIFIISQKNRLWLTRGFVFLILVILGELRKDENSERKICPNLLISESNMKWKKKKRNVYVASDLVLLQPIFDKDNTYFRFLKKNKWIKKYFSHVNTSFDNLRKIEKSKNFLMKWLESLAYLMQHGYMQKRRTEEIIKSDFIHFNKNDNTNRVLSKFNKIQKEYL